MKPKKRTYFKKPVTILRGYNVELHSEILKRFESLELTKFKGFEKLWEPEIVGGGRIYRDNEKRKIIISDYNCPYGQANHALTKRMLENKFKGWSVQLADSNSSEGSLSSPLKKDEL